MNISEIAAILGLEFLGEDRKIERLGSIFGAKEDELTYFDDTRFTSHVANTKAAAVIIKKDYAQLLPTCVGAIISENPQLDLAKISEYFFKNIKKSNQDPIFKDNCEISKNSYVGNGSHVGSNVKIMHGAYIGENVLIGDGTVIYPNVVVYDNSQIGKNCILHAGCIIGSDGFGYAHTKEGEHIKIYHFGKVVLEDFVEIGANSTIDRGVFEETRIKKGTKIDNLVQIGHNCTLGQNCIIVSQAGVAGSSKLGKNVVMGGQSAVAGHIEVGDFATIAGRGGVTKSIDGGQTYAGFPLMPHREWLKLQAKISKL